MNLAQNSAATALGALNALYDSATLTLYQGAIPSAPENSISGQAMLARFTFAKQAFAAPQFTTLQEVAQAAFAEPSVAPTASGTACFARAAAGGSALADYTVGAAWQAASTVVAGQYVINNGNTYVCQTGGTTAASGGPSGAGTNIADGTAVWNFNNAGSPDIVLASTTLATDANVSVSSFTHALPAV